MKSILVADTHLGVRQGIQLYNDINTKLFTQMCEHAEEHNCEGFIHLGDFFDNRESIKIKTILTALSIMEMLDRTFPEIRLIVGNHDTIYKDDVYNSLLRIFERFREDIIVDRPQMMYGNILMVPWLFDTEIFENHHKADILMGHFDIVGCKMNEHGSISEHGYNISDFKNFEQTYSGHYHTPGVYEPNTICYLGSPFQTTFNDVGGQRGFYEFNHDTHACKFIEFTDYPKFIRVRDTDQFDEMKPSYIKGNIVELIFTEDHGIEGNIAIVEQVKNMEPMTLNAKYVSIDDSMSQEDIVEEDIEIHDHLDMLREYYNYSEQPEHIDIKMLNKMTETIYKEIIDGK
jgi:DNA repair exonuclease SbcCD nuclease subunit